MAVINKMQLEDGSTPIMGFNEVGCEYILDDGAGCYIPKFVYQIFDYLLHEEEKSFPEDFQFPFEHTGFYVTKSNAQTEGMTLNYYFQIVKDTVTEEGMQVNMYIVSTMLCFSYLTLPILPEVFVVANVEGNWNIEVFKQ